MAWKKTLGLYKDSIHSEVKHMETGKKKPIKTIRYPPIRLSIWKDMRKTADGKAFESLSVTLDRAYKDAQGNWQNAQSFREADLPKVEAAVRDAFVFIARRDNDKGMSDENDLDIEEQTVAAPWGRM